MHRILLAAVESKPYATAGGTSDVVGALTGILEQEGYDVRLVLPHYSNLVGEPKYQVEHVTDLRVPFGGGSVAASVFSTERRTYLIDNDPQGYFARVGRDGVPLYPVLEDRAVHAGRLYAFFCRAVLELARAFNDDGWQPDVIHCHDWPAGLIPAYAKTVLKDEPFLQGVSVVYTIHNMSDVVYQGGWFRPDLLLDAGLPFHLFVSGQLRHNEHVNFVKAGIVFSDRVNTVSEGYATEIQDGLVASYETLNGTHKRFLYSGGLDEVWSDYGVDLLGIRNGIDDAYDPRLIGQGEDWQFVDEDWKSNYAPAGGRSISEWAYSSSDPQLQRRKQDIKRYLQERCNRLLGTQFQVSEAIPVVAVRSRLTEQKGFDLIVRGLRDWRPAEPVQFVIVAWGEERYAKELRKLATSQPQWIAFSDSWRAAPEPLHYTGADFLLMPSLFEPCGLPHMMALRYGTVPIVRRTGGLADVVVDFDPEAGVGNGFVFDLPEPDHMLQAVEQAVAIYRHQPEMWRSLLGNAMKGRDRFGQDFTWTTAVERYIPELYAIRG
jgi:starch synthase